MESGWILEVAQAGVCGRPEATGQDDVARLSRSGCLVAAADGANSATSAASSDSSPSRQAKAPPAPELEAYIDSMSDYDSDGEDDEASRQHPDVPNQERLYDLDWSMSDLQSCHLGCDSPGGTTQVQRLVQRSATEPTPATKFEIDDFSDYDDDGQMHMEASSLPDKDGVDWAGVSGDTLPNISSADAVDEGTESEEL